MQHLNLKRPFILMVLCFSLPVLAYLQKPAQIQTGMELTNWKTLSKDQKISIELSQLVEEYRTFQATARVGQSFRSQNTMALQEDNWVRIEAVAENDGRRLLELLEQVGLQDGVAFQRVVNGRLPMAVFSDARIFSQMTELLKIGVVHRPYRRVGAITTQGDFAQNSDWVRDYFNTDGTGVNVGILSDSYDFNGGAAAGIASGDLPGTGNPNGYTTPVNILQDDGQSDEGRAMAEIIHDIAPGAGIAFRTANLGIADFASGIVELATTGLCDIIVDDIGYFASPFFQDGLVAQAADQVFADGVTYFSAAGNAADQSYQAGYNAGDVINIVPDYDVIGHDFGGDDYLQSVTIPAGGSVIISLQWTDPFTSVSGLPGPQTDIDFFLYSEDGTSIVAFSAENNIEGDPVEVLSYVNDSEADVNLNLLIGIFDGPAPTFLKYIFFGDMIINEYATLSSTCYGQPNAAGAIAVGASFVGDTPNFGVNPPLLEPFSSHGATPIFFNTGGSAVSPFTRLKPEIVSPDGGDNTFFGIDFDENGFFNFFGTSAAAPHAVGIAALLLELNPDLTPADIELLMVNATFDMLTPGYDVQSGFGLVDGFQAAVAGSQCAQELNLSILSSTYGTSTFFAKNTITSDMQVDSDLDLRAGDEIRLMPGFSTTPGVSFSAAIDEVTCEPENLLSQKDPAQNRSFAASPILPTIRQDASMVGRYALKSEPNPFHQTSTIHFELPEDQTVAIQLVDLTGKVVREIQQPTTLEKGIHQIEFSDSKLPGGFYYLVLDLPTGRETRPFIKL